MAKVELKCNHPPEYEGGNVCDQNSTHFRQAVRNLQSVRSGVSMSAVGDMKHVASNVQKRTETQKSLFGSMIDCYDAQLPCLDFAIKIGEGHTLVVDRPLLGKKQVEIDSDGIKELRSETQTRKESVEDFLSTYEPSSEWNARAAIEFAKLGIANYKSYSNHKKLLKKLMDAVDA